MMLKVEATKAYSEYINENPGTYDGIIAYAFDDLKNDWEPVAVPDTTKATVMDWFQYRTVCDDVKFGTFFKRKMNICALRYANMLRIEMSSFDPLVADYMETEIEENQTKVSSGTESNTKNSTNTNDSTSSSVRTPDLEYNDATAGTSNDTSNRTTESNANTTDNGESSDNVSHAGSAKGKEAAMGKNAPQSISYAAAVAGSIPSLDWQYATNQGQTENESSDTSADTTAHDDSRTSVGTNNGSEAGTNHGETSGTNNRTETGTDTTAGTSKSTNVTADVASGDKSSADSADAQKREVHTGRGGLTAQDAFKSAVRYIENSSAFEWLREELEECFLGVYDI